MAAPALSGRSPSPPQLERPHDGYAVINQTLVDAELRRSIAGALTAFANHDDTHARLEQYR
jgi:hypothetical protein